MAWASLFIRLMGWSILQLENIRSLARTLRNAELMKGSRVPFRRSVRQSESLRVYSGVEVHLELLRLSDLIF